MIKNGFSFRLDYWRIVTLSSKTLKLTCNSSGVLTRYCSREYNCQRQLHRGRETTIDLSTTLQFEKLFDSSVLALGGGGVGRYPVPFKLRRDRWEIYQKIQL